jgi:cysteine synthase B
MTAMVQEMRSKPIMTNPTAPVLEGMGLLEAIGNTPLLPLRRVTRDISPGVKIYAKAEWFNPGGSVKDRPAFNIIRRAVFEGKLHPGMRLLDSTSGNMGIAYATFGAALDIHITLAMPSNASPERTAILRALGAELVLTDAMEGSDGAIQVARQMAGDRPDLYFYANQYDNPANWQAHYNTTGPEIFDQTRGSVTHFVAGLGTSGTLMGVSKYLREYNPGIEIVAVQPDSPFHLYPIHARPDHRNPHRTSLRNGLLPGSRRRLFCGNLLGRCSRSSPRGGLGTGYRHHCDRFP